MNAWISKTLRHAGWVPLTVVAFYAVAAKVFDAYIRWPNLDMATHFCGGLAITYFFFVAVTYSQAIVGPIPRIVRLLAGLGFTTLAAVCWEFLEFLSDAWFGTKMNLGVSDTLSDLFFGVLGGLVALLVIGWSKMDEPTSGIS